MERPENKEEVSCQVSKAASGKRPGCWLLSFVCDLGFDLLSLCHQQASMKGEGNYKGKGQVQALGV